MALCNPMDYTIHGILQARILEWVAIPFSRGSLQEDSLPLSHQGNPRLEWAAYSFPRGSS